VSEFGIKLQAARGRLPLRRLMEQHGKAPDGKKCPYCGKKGTGLFKGDDGELFKCWHATCPTGTNIEGGAWDEIGFLAYELRLPRAEAAVEYLKEAGVWEERERYAPSVLPGKAGRKKKIPDANETEEDETLIQECWGLFKAEGRASVTLLQRRLQLGYGRAFRIVAELEKRGLVGPARGQEPRLLISPKENLPAAASSPPTTPPLAAAESSADSCASPDLITGSTQESQSPGDAGAVPPAPSLSAEGANVSPAGPPAAAQKAMAGKPDLTAGETTFLKKAASSKNQAPEKSQTPNTKEDAETRRRGDAEKEKESPPHGGTAGATGVVANGTDPAPSLRSKDQAPNTKSQTADSGGTPLPPAPPPRKGPPGPPGGGGWVSGPPDEGDMGPLTALRWFYEQLPPLTEEDGKMLWEKRGLTPATQAAAGLRSNLRGNKEILLAMEELFPSAVRVESGLWTNGDKPGDPPKPNAQFYGYGIVGKKKKLPGEERGAWSGERGAGRDERDKFEWGWTHPILIPYFDEQGEVIHLRPHKGMMREKSPRMFVVRRGKTPADDKHAEAPSSKNQTPPAEAPSSKDQAPNKAQTPNASEEKVIRGAFGESKQIGNLRYGRLETCATGSEEDEHKPGPEYAVITEGEFKALAVWQALTGKAAVGSLPGITMAKALFGDIEQWLLETEVRQVVIAYDNEEKGDPKLPGFKEEKRDRFDSEVWARYLCKRIAKEGWDTRVAHLPDEWRDPKTGKADWDAALAMGIAVEVKRTAASAETPSSKNQAPGKHQTPNPNWREEAERVWGRVAGKVAVEFLKVLKAGIKMEETWQAGFFDSEEERIIRNKLERISYEPKLPVGDEHELAMARRLHRLASKLRVNGGAQRLPSKDAGFLHLLAKKYQDTKGRYYVLKPLSEKVHDNWAGCLKKAAERDDVEVKRACEVALAGVPQWVSDFRMRAHYVLNRLDGTRERIVTLRNVHGVESRVVALTSDAFAQPSRYREWLLNQISGATWKAGERELNDLQADVAHEVAWKDVGEVAVRGYDENSRLWFFRAEDRAGQAD